jgi:glycosyltransferase involved in cell wall biosynthesis
MTPRTSVVIPSYDYARFLPAAIASVLAQTDADLELLVVDDGSTDGSLELARACRDPRVRVLARAHAGLPAARNAGMRAARGRYLAFLDADDLWEPEKLALQVGVLEREAAAGLVYARFGVIDAEGRVRAGGRSLLARKPSGAILPALLRGNVVGTPSTVCLRRALVEPGGLRFDETGRYTEDWHFYLLAATRTRVRHLPRTLAWHRQHDRSMQGDLDAMRQRNLATVELALELARAHLGLGGRALRRAAARLHAYVESVEARERFKAGDFAGARAHAARALRRRPWDPRDALLYLAARAPWMPRAAVASRLR